MIDRRRLRLALVPLAVLAIGSCGDATGPNPAAVADVAAHSGLSAPALIVCPNLQRSSATRTVGPLGGTLAVGGHIVRFPAGAVPEPTEFTLTVAASDYVEIEVTANGQDHYRFQLPVTLTINYARCAHGSFDLTRLQIFYIDGDSKAIREKKGGLDDKLARQVTTTTDHFSSYAIGAN
jgi:hypothetical protein